jgi:hypothetical protein
MKRIVFYGWEIGMKSLQFAQLLHKLAGVELKEAWAIKEKVVDGETVAIEVREDIAGLLIDKASIIGVQCRIEE